MSGDELANGALWEDTDEQNWALEVQITFSVNINFTGQIDGLLPGIIMFLKPES